MLSVIVDDYDMNISDIIRGDDHLIMPKQKLIYDLLNGIVQLFPYTFNSWTR